MRSGGVDSSVVAALLAKAWKAADLRVRGYGLLVRTRVTRSKSIWQQGEYDLNFVRVNAQERYYTKARWRDRPRDEA